jgi:proline dehydrogenase
MALILGIQFFHIRVIREIRGSAASRNLRIKIYLGFGNWDLELLQRLAAEARELTLIFSSIIAKSE